MPSAGPGHQASRPSPGRRSLPYPPPAPQPGPAPTRPRPDKAPPLPPGSSARGGLRTRGAGPTRPRKARGRLPSARKPRAATPPSLRTAPPLTSALPRPSAGQPLTPGPAVRASGLAASAEALLRLLDPLRFPVRRAERARAGDRRRGRADSRPTPRSGCAPTSPSPSSAARPPLRRRPRPRAHLPVAVPGRAPTSPSPPLAVRPSFPSPSSSAHLPVPNCPLDLAHPARPRPPVYTRFTRVHWLSVFGKARGCVKYSLLKTGL